MLDTRGSNVLCSSFFGLTSTLRDPGACITSIMLRLFAGLTSLLYSPRSRSVSIACIWHVRNMLPWSMLYIVPNTAQYLHSLLTERLVTLSCGLEDLDPTLKQRWFFVCWWCDLIGWSCYGCSHAEQWLAVVRVAGSEWADGSELDNRTKNSLVTARRVEALVWMSHCQHLLITSLIPMVIKQDRSFW